MEKARFRCSGLFALIIVGYLSSLSAVVAATKTVTVEVEVPVKGGDEASSLEKARGEAFKKVYAKTLPTSVDTEAREKELKKAANYIKSFQVVSKQRIGNTLKVSYQCEVLVSSKSSGSGFKDAKFFEIEWRNSRRSLNSAELVRYLAKNGGADVQTIKFHDGGWWLAIRSSQSTQQILTQLRSYVGSRASVGVSSLGAALPKRESSVEQVDESGEEQFLFE